MSEEGNPGPQRTTAMLSSQFFPAGDALDGVVEAIWDAEFDDASAARALTIKVLPTTSPVLIVH
jgi:hypothetical protein